MPSQIRIVLDDGEAAATLNDSPTAAAIRAALPLEGTVSLWGEEIYFSIPVEAGEAPDARQDMAVGELGYWPRGAALCIFFGPTPASAGQLPRAYSNVNPLGQVDGPQPAIKALFAEVRDGQKIRVLPV
ncbi:MAG: cyclophilin-like fold protein [bacterium]